MRERRCETCGRWDNQPAAAGETKSGPTEYPTTVGMGLCRRSPPVDYAVDNPPAPWPYTGKDDWCGAWNEKD